MGGHLMQQAALDWLSKHHEDIVHGLADLVAIQSISTDGDHNPEIERSAKLTCDQMRGAGLHNVVEEWQGDPWKLTRRDGRLYARGAADDKGAISAQLAAVAAYRKTANH